MRRHSTNLESETEDVLRTVFMRVDVAMPTEEHDRLCRAWKIECDAIRDEDVYRRDRAREEVRAVYNGLILRGIKAAAGGCRDIALDKKQREQCAIALNWLLDRYGKELHPDDANALMAIVT